MTSFPNRDALVVLIGLVGVNLIGVAYGHDAWSPFRLIPNLCVLLYTCYKLRQ